MAEYRDVVGFVGYVVGSDGSVWSRWLPRRRILGGELRRIKSFRDGCGYLQVHLYKNGSKSILMLHRVVLEAFVGPCPEGMECLHNDDDKSNCDVSNLSWGTRARNMSDAASRGLCDKKLDAGKRAEVIRLVAGGEKRSSVAKRFGIGVRYVGELVTGRKGVTNQTGLTPPRA